ncbi:hypothetical protein EI94DRAFT_1681797, partial [Lactarius quietus]
MPDPNFLTSFVTHAPLDIQVQAHSIMKNAMSGNEEHILADPERGLGPGGWVLPSENFMEEATVEPEELSKPDPRSSPGGGGIDYSPPEGQFSVRSRKERKDFDDGANALWSLYGKEAKAHDEAHFLSLASDMDGVLLFAGLFSAVVTSFLVQTLPNLQVNPMDQLSVVILDQISQQIASITLQVSTPSTVPPSTPTVSPIAQQFPNPITSMPPYPLFKPYFADIRVNAFWLVGLICSLSAALLALFVQRWIRSYMLVFQRYDHPLKRARYRQFFFEGDKGMRNLAEAVPRLIHVSLFLFFFGLGDSMLNTNTTIGTMAVIIIILCGGFYAYSVSTQLWHSQSPYQTPITRAIFRLKR